VTAKRSRVDRISLKRRMGDAKLRRWGEGAADRITTRGRASGAHAGCVNCWVSRRSMSKWTFITPSCLTCQRVWQQQWRQRRNSGQWHRSRNRKPLSIGVATHLNSLASPLAVTTYVWKIGSLHCQWVTILAISRDLNLFQIESQNFQIELQSFKSNLYISNHQNGSNRDLNPNRDWDLPITV